MSERIISGLRFESPVMVGAGPIKLPEQVLEIAKSDSSAIIVGSITIEERAGNPGVSYHAEKDYRFSLNSKGLPNPGLEYYKKHLPEIAQIAHSSGKPLIVSAAGFSPDEYVVLAGAILNGGADGLEINLGCPNVWGKDGHQKRIASFDQDLTGEILQKVESEVGREAWTSVKLSPFSDPSQLEVISKIISRSELVKAVTTTNTFPNAFAFREGDTPAIDPASGLAGLSGSAMKPIGLGQVKQFRSLLPPAIAVIGIGGVSTKQDVDDYLNAGATIVGITTAYVNFGPSIFSQVKSE